ncbi:hypothetical protein AVM02_15735 [Brucella anthropi]
MVPILGFTRAKFPENRLETDPYIKSIIKPAGTVPTDIGEKVPINCKPIMGSHFVYSFEKFGIFR